MKNRPQTYSSVVIPPAALGLLQLEWSYVEQPAPRPRFLNFPFVDREALEAPPVAVAPAEAQRVAA